MESRFAYDFGRVRVFDGSDAADAASAVGAHAFATGDALVFGAGAYEPHTPRGRYVLAHELRHVMQRTNPDASHIGEGNGAAHRDAHAAAIAVLRGERPPPVPHGLQRAPVERIARDDDPIHRSIIEDYRHERGLPLSGRDTEGGQIGPTDAEIKYGPQRTDYVFIMGQDRPASHNPFYALALRYFRAHVPNAVFVTDKRTLADVLRYVGALLGPAGTIYLVSHANEDGTLSFGLTSSDADGHTDANELRAALHPTTGASTLPAVNGKIDARTKISIKGCNIGQSQEMVELIDEAFGGAGEVVAPKYEQTFGADPRRGAAEHGRIDTEIRHADAKRDTSRATELRTYEARDVERAATTEGLSGPHIERPGTQLLTRGEIGTHVATTFSDLPERERASIASALERAQHVETVTPWTERFLIPTDQRAMAAFAQPLRDAGFVARRLRSHTRSPGPQVVHTYIFEDAQGAANDFTIEEPKQADVIARARARNSRPDNFIWSVAQRRNGDNLDFVGVGQRVVAELHHRALTDRSGAPYDPSTPDPRFFAHSTYQPPPATTVP